MCLHSSSNPPFCVCKGVEVAGWYDRSATLITGPDLNASTGCGQWQIALKALAVTTNSFQDVASIDGGCIMRGGSLSAKLRETAESGLRGRAFRGGAHNHIADFLSGSSFACAKHRPGFLEVLEILEGLAGQSLGKT
jgi:hypothetical protein